MHIKTIQVFCDVVRLRSFSKAAAENGMSQSAASQMVHQLEQRLGVKLIDRSKRPFVLTHEGKMYYEESRVLLEKYLALEDRVRGLKAALSGRVHVVSIYSVGLHHMNRYIQQFLARYPKANVRLEYLHPDRVYRSVQRDTADLGLVSYPRQLRSIRVIPWRSEPMVLVCSPEHPFAARKSLPVEQLQGQAAVTFDRNLRIRRELDRQLHRRGVELDVVMEFDNIETIKRAIEINAGVGILPQPTVAREVAAGSLCAVPLQGVELVRPIGIIVRRNRELGPTAQLFIELLKQGHGWQEEEPPDRAPPRPQAKAPAVPR